MCEVVLYHYCLVWSSSPLSFQLPVTFICCTKCVYFFLPRILFWLMSVCHGMIVPVTESVLTLR